MIDAGDIKQSLEGFSTIGRGQTDLSTFYRWFKSDFHEAIKERGSSAGALQLAESNLGLKIQTEDARKILALITGPKDVLAMNMLEEISTYLQDKSPKAVIRIGDYPRRAKEMSVTIIASMLTRVNRLETLYLQADNMFKRQKELEKENEQTIDKMRAAAKNLPTLD